MAQDNNSNVINLADSLQEGPKPSTSGMMQANSELSKTTLASEAPAPVITPTPVSVTSTTTTTTTTPESSAANLDKAEADNSEMAPETEATSPEEIKKSTKGLTIELDVIAILIVTCLIGIGVVVYYGWFTNTTQTAQIEEVKNLPEASASVEAGSETTTTTPAATSETTTTPEQAEPTSTTPVIPEINADITPTDITGTPVISDTTPIEVTPIETTPVARPKVKISK